MGTKPLACATFALAMVASAPAVAADSEEVEALIRQGVDLRQQGKDERALPLFQRAFQLVESPRTSGQLGLAEMAVGYWLEAERHLGLALESADHPWVAKNRRTLEQSLAAARANIGELIVDGTPMGAAVEVNGRPGGTLPLPGPVRVSKGRVRVDVNAPGHTAATRTLTVAGGDRQHVTVALDKVPVVAEDGSKSPAGVVAPTTAPTGTASTSIASSSSLTAGADATLSGSRPLPADDGFTTGQKLGLALGIAGGAALVGAAIETVLWQAKRNDFNDVDGAGNGKCFDNVANNGAPGCKDLHDSLKQAQTFAIVGYAAAVVLGGASVILFLTSSKPAASESRVACAPVFGSPGVTCRLRF